MDGLLNSDAILNPEHPDHIVTQAEAQQLSQLQRLTSSEAYWDPSHVDHDLVKTRVRRFFDSTFEGETHGRRVSPIVIDTSDLNHMRPR